MTAPDWLDGLLAAFLLIAWLLVMALGDAAVIVHSTTHNPATTTFAIAAGMLAADWLASFVVALAWAFPGGD